MEKRISKKSIQKESKIVTSQDSSTTDRPVDTNMSNEATFRTPVRMAGPSISSYRDVTTRPGRRPDDRVDIGNAISSNIEGISRLAAKIIQSTLANTNDILNALTGSKEYEHNGCSDSHCSCHQEQHHPCCHEDHHEHYHDSCCHAQHGGHSYAVSRCNSVHGC